MTFKKIVINVTYGGFSLDKEVFFTMVLLGYKPSDNQFKLLNPDLEDWYFYDEIERHNEFFVKAVEVLQKEGKCKNLRVVEIPSDVEYFIQDYDGREWIAEIHRTWH